MHSLKREWLISFKIVTWLAFAAILFSGCVANKKYVLLQKDDINRNDMPVDTVVRTYTPKEYQYRIQPEDILSIQFESLTPKEFDFLSGVVVSSAGSINLSQGSGLLIGHLVDHHGEIPFPFLGKVKISDLTVFEVQDKLQQISGQYLDHPVVKVRLINFRFTVLGEVNKEGTVMVNNNRVNLLEALGLAGGMTDLAERSRVKLIRQNLGKTEIIYLDLLREDFIESPHYYLHQNDILIVSSLRQRPYRRYFGQNIALVLSSLSLIILSVNLLNSN